MATNSPFSFTIGSLPEIIIYCLSVGRDGDSIHIFGRTRNSRRFTRTKSVLWRTSSDLSRMPMHPNALISKTFLPFLLFCRMSLASNRVTPCGATIKSSSFVITFQKWHGVMKIVEFKTLQNYCIYFWLIHIARHRKPRLTKISIKGIHEHNENLHWSLFLSSMNNSTQF